MAWTGRTTRGPTNAVQRSPVVRDTQSDKRNDLRLDRGGNGLSRTPRGDSSLGELFGSLWSDTAHLIQMEVRLAKSEMQASARTAARAGAKLGIALVLALPGAMALTAALVIGLGAVLDNYWLSALIVGVVVLAVAGVLARKALAAFHGAFSAKETAHTLRESADWARAEAKRVKTSLTT
jgi:uncharacterized membrane protein YqjE